MGSDERIALNRFQGGTDMILILTQKKFQLFLTRKIMQPFYPSSFLFSQ